MPLKSLALTSSSVRVGMTAESTCHSLFSSGRSEITGRALSLGKHNTRAHCNSGLFPGIGAITARILGNGGTGTGTGTETHEEEQTSTLAPASDLMVNWCL
jgi:hypothetical protein